VESFVEHARRAVEIDGEQLPERIRPRWPVEARSGNQPAFGVGGAVVQLQRIPAAPLDDRLRRVATVPLPDARAVDEGEAAFIVQRRAVHDEVAQDHGSLAHRPVIAEEPAGAVGPVQPTGRQVPNR